MRRCVRACRAYFWRWFYYFYISRTRSRVRARVVGRGELDKFIRAIAAAAAVHTFIFREYLHVYAVASAVLWWLIASFYRFGRIAPVSPCWSPRCRRRRRRCRRRRCRAMIIQSFAALLGERMRSAVRKTVNARIAGRMLLLLLFIALSRKSAGVRTCRIRVCMRCVVTSRNHTAQCCCALQRATCSAQPLNINSFSCTFNILPLI